MPVLPLADVAAVQRDHHAQAQGLRDRQGQGAATRELRVQDWRHWRQGRHTAEVAEQQPAQWSQRPVAADLQPLATKLLRVRQDQCGRSRPGAAG